MAFDSRGLDAYNDVPARIAEFRTKHPDGSLQPVDPGKPFEVVEIGGQTFIAYYAAAYRTPDDTRPGIGCAYEPFPGRTPYTKGSELQNAETSAWGRAIVAVGAADTRKGIASQEEVRNRRADRDAAPSAAMEIRNAALAATDPDVVRDLYKRAAAESLGDQRVPDADGVEVDLPVFLAARGKALAQAAAPAGKAAQTQHGRMQVLFAEVGQTDPDEQRRYISEFIGREVESRSHLTAAEADTVIAKLASWSKQNTEPQMSGAA